MRILVVWNKAVQEQLITNNPSWLETYNKTYHPATWNFRIVGTIPFLNRQLKGHCQWQNYVGFPNTQETQLSMLALTLNPNPKFPSSSCVAFARQYWVKHPQ